jgi:hypothetical protein
LNVVRIDLKLVTLQLSTEFRVVPRRNSFVPDVDEGFFVSY